MDDKLLLKRIYHGYKQNLKRFNDRQRSAYFLMILIIDWILFVTNTQYLHHPNVRFPQDTLGIIIIGVTVLLSVSYYLAVMRNPFSKRSQTNHFIMIGTISFISQLIIIWLMVTA